MTDKRESGVFDERAALDQLERFREGIARERARRRAVSDEFDSFVRSLKTPSPPVPTAPAPAPQARAKAPAAAPAAPAPAPVSTRPAPPRIDLPRTPRVDAAPPPMVPVDPHAMFPTEIEPRMAAPPQRRRVALVMLAVLLLGGLAAWALWPTGPAAPAAEVTNTSAPAPTSDEPPPATEAATTPAAPESRVTELTTTRNVWVRVIADGERVVERELPAGSRIPITAQKTIVIRTGDAGAVTLRIAGEDQGALGREGQVVTRTFTVPER
jgi:hypothetical protein